MSAQSFHFNPEQRRAIDRTLARYLEIDNASREALIKDIEETGSFRVFGYGSLIGEPHAKPDEQFPAVLDNFRRDAVFSDRHLRGTPHRLGLTMGIIATGTSGEKLRGLVQVIRIPEGGSDQDFADRVIENIRAFACRETSLNPIYAYQIVNVRSQFGMAKALVCGTDENNPQYVGPAVDADDGKHLTLKEKAAIIAGSYGVLGASERNTGLAYWRYILDCAYKAGMELEPHVKRLVSLANAYRQKLPRELRRRLEKLEDIPERATFDPRVFEADIAGLKQSARAVKRYRRNARIKLGNRDPLPPARLAMLKARMHELRV